MKFASVAVAATVVVSPLVFMDSEMVVASFVVDGTSVVS